MKTNELTGTALDWAVAQCDGVAAVWREDESALIFFDREEGGEREWRPVTDWAQGGPIIEREMIELVPQTPALWDAMYRTQHIPNDGPTPLIAAMRCYVAFKLGDEINVPEELK